MTLNDIDTQLLDASKEGNIDIVKQCLENGANIEAGDNDGYRPLHLASQNGHAAVVEFLLSKGAQIEAESTERVRPLHWGVYHGHTSVVKLLLAAGALIEPKNNWGHDALFLSMHEKFAEIEAMLREAIKTRAEDPERVTADE